MRQVVSVCGPLVAGFMLSVCLFLDEPWLGQAAEQAPAVVAGPTLSDAAAGRAHVIDLAWPLSADSPYWPGDNYKPFELTTIATLEKDGVLSKAFCSPEHLGTHIDAPNHFERGQPSVDQIPAPQLFAPGIVIDISASSSANADYLLNMDDIARFEAKNGRIPSGAIVLAFTGWSRFWNIPARYQGKDVMGRLHFPGYSAEAAKFLADERAIRGLGIDTLSVDFGLSRDFVVHHVLGKAGRYGLENLARLDALPPKGFWLIVAPMKIETGSGGPTRVFAVMP